MAGLFRVIRRSTGSLATPVNYIPPDPSQIDQHVAYALQVAESTLHHLQAMGAELDGCSLLELGPGFEFGPQLILASHGAHVTIADRFLAPWDENYHPAFYGALRDSWRGPSSALDRVIREGRYHPRAIVCIEEPAETLRGVRDLSFDVVISNAVLEHVTDPVAVAATLARVTRPGGLHSHQIDFCDHRNFEAPLEFLLMSEAEFASASRSAQMQFGNRWRSSDFLRVFRAAGFLVGSVERNEHNNPEYVSRFVTKLRASRSPFKSTVVDDLECGGARLVLRRRANDLDV